MKMKVPESPVDLVEWRKLSFFQKLRPLVVDLVENGAATPWFVYAFYIVKMAIYVAVGVAIITATPGFGLSNAAEWWHEPVVYQKILAYTYLVEALGLGGSSGPLAFKLVKPFVAAAHWGRVGTIRQPPWPKALPFTRGDTRTMVDVALYVGLIGVLVAMLVDGGPGTAADPMSGTASDGLIIALLGVAVVLGLRDKVAFIGSRGDMYLWPLGLFLFPYEQAIAGLQVALALVWFGAGISKLMHHFSPIVAVMNSTGPLRPRWFKRALYRNFPDDLRPSWLTHTLAHSGTVIELAVPTVLLFSSGGTVSAVGVGLLVLLHIVILLHIPLAVPNEWNIFMMIAAVWLYWTHAEIGPADLSAGVVAYLLVLLVFPLVYGSLRPDRISFVMAMRYYAGNWAAGVWCFRNGAERRLSPNIKKAAPMVHEQLETLYNAEHAELVNVSLRGWRSLYPQGRALNGLLERGLDDLEDYVQIDGEVIGCAINGWNMGDGHMHNEQLIASVQKRCNFEPGELIVIMIESQPIHRGDIAYRIVDAATGRRLESGLIRVSDFVDRQPWDETPLPVQVSSSSRTARRKELQ